jgi:hypothetical protein
MRSRGERRGEISNSDHRVNQALSPTARTHSVPRIASVEKLYQARLRLMLSLNACCARVGDLPSSGTDHKSIPSPARIVTGIQWAANALRSLRRSSEFSCRAPGAEWTTGSFRESAKVASRVAGQRPDEGRDPTERRPRMRACWADSSTPPGRRNQFHNCVDLKGRQRGRRCHSFFTRRSSTIPGGMSGGRRCSRSGRYTPHADSPFFDRASARHRQSNEKRSVGRVG